MNQLVADVGRLIRRDEIRLLQIEKRAASGALEARELREFASRANNLAEHRELLVELAHRQQTEVLNRFLYGGSSRILDVTDPYPLEARALSKLTGSAGANTVDVGFYDQLVSHLIEVSGILRAARLYVTDKGDSLPIPTTTAHSTGALIAEGATIPTSEPTFGQRSLGAYKFGAGIGVSGELLSDAAATGGIDLIGYLSMELGRALSNAVGGYAATGTGSSQPAGLIPNATVGVTGGTGVSGAPTASDVRSLFYSVIAPYRALSTAGWVMRDSTLLAIRQLADSAGQPVFPAMMRPDGVELLMGAPVYTDPFVPAIGLGARSIVYGDLSRFVVRIVRGVRLERATGPGFNQNIVQFRGLLRADTALTDVSGALRAFVGGAS